MTRNTDTPSLPHTSPHSQSAEHKQQADNPAPAADPHARALNVWDSVQSDLIAQFGMDAHRSWTERLSVHSAGENTVMLSAPSRFIGTRVETHYGESLRDFWARYDSRDVKVVALGQPRRSQSSPAPSKAQRPASYARMAKETGLTTNPSPSKTRHTERGSSAQNIAPAFHTARSPISKHERFTFDNFIVAPCNELAHAVARKIANSTKAEYNPVVFYGKHGMGKTHLLHALKSEAEAHDVSRRVKLISSEQFVANFVSSVRSSSRGDMDKFKASLRDVDLLIIDDAHFIADKPGSQEELLHTLIALVSEGKQVVLASDRHPHEIAKASTRLRSYLCAGLLCDVGQADYDLRRRILDRLIALRRANGSPNLVVPDEACKHLAARANATPRDLEGAFNQVVARSEFLGRPVTLETVQDALAHACYNAGIKPTVDKIQRATAAEFDVSLDELLSKRRSRNIARPRQVAMYLSKMLTTRSLPDIGRRFGGRDHTTVIHAVKRIEALRAEDPVLNSHIDALIETLQG